ncbi:AAA family ATPase [Lysinibacillus sp. fls2-241-R2A-57]|uniref:ATP-dependent nuclease n=1 Tax=Lysinibacillus sp. fls2-241-R2A-57 TaxID=3040292 RepID=UPI002553CF95|nr:AAA family ATPase [Lysinibacillus sp. fls2-241-R2A-57]
MYLESISLYNFRKYKVKEDNSAGITVYFNPNFNILVGENDAGKTAIIDGIRYLLGSVSDEFERINQEDFYSPSKDEYVNDFCIEGVFGGLTDKEAGSFLEWLSFDEKKNYKLRVALRVEKRINENGTEYIEKKLLGGDEIFESRLDSKAKEFLKTTYLKPLRDASAELKPGFKSRLANILKAHPTFKGKKEVDHQLVKVMQEANKQVENYFETDYVTGHSLLTDIETLLKDFYDNAEQSKSKAKFAVTKTDLTSILRKLSLNTEDINLGLGNQNLLFIATELLLMNNYLSEKEIIGPQITLIEEIEAHLHTQAQIRLIKFLEKELEEKQNISQFILTSHSPNLIASIDPKNIILLHSNYAYPMGEEFTKLESMDYKFLERFLDSTKSNLFFAKGIILVEGESEMLLLPALADVIGFPMYKNGVSLVNVRGTSFERYIKLFSRTSLWTKELGFPSLNMPVSIITDVDVIPHIYYEEEGVSKVIFRIDNESELDKILSHIEEEKEKLKMDYFGEDYSTLRKLAKDFKFKVLKANEDELTAIIGKEITFDYIEQLNIKKQSNLLERYRKDYDCNLTVNIAPKWTLEYSLSLSVLARLLYESIYEIQGQDVDLEFEETLAEIEGTTLNKEKAAYKIFKPLNDKNVSKAEVAQLLATKITDLSQKEKSILREAILKDPHLEYLVSAIKHASKTYQEEIE